MKCCISDVKMNGDRSLGDDETEKPGGFEFTPCFYDFLRASAAQVTSSYALNKFGSPLKGPELLRVAHDLAEVYVKHVSAVFQHDVVVVAVTDPQNECGHAPAGTRVDKVHHSLEIY